MSDRDRYRHVRISKGEGCWKGQFEAMASPCEVLCETQDSGEAERLSNLVAIEAWRIEDKFSRYLEGNIVDQVNRAAGKPVTLDVETAHLVDFAVTLYVISEHRFDITSGALRRVWRFDGSDHIPSVEDVAAAMDHVGWHRVSWESRVLQMPPQMEIDFGGLGKEYAVDKAAELLRERTASSCLINFGGDLAVTATPKHMESWNVGIEALGASPAPANLLNLRVGALATSGDARRFLLKDGVRYSHILDPLTGWPVPGAPGSITVAADTCTQAGMLSTLAMLQGEGAEAFLDAQDSHYWCNR